MSTNIIEIYLLHYLLSVLIYGWSERLIIFCCIAINGPLILCSFHNTIFFFFQPNVERFVHHHHHRQWRHQPFAVYRLNRVRCTVIASNSDECRLLVPLQRRSLEIKACCRSVYFNVMFFVCVSAALAIGERRLKYAAIGFEALAIVTDHERQKVFNLFIVFHFRMTHNTFFSIHKSNQHYERIAINSTTIFVCECFCCCCINIKQVRNEIDRGIENDCIVWK